MSSARPSSRARRVVSLAQNKRDTTWRSAAYVRDATHAKSALDYEPWVMVPPPAGASGILLPRPRTPHETRVLAARRAVEAAAVELRARQRVGPDGAPLARADQRRESDSSSLGFGSSLDAESSELSFLRPVEDEHPNRLAVDDAACAPRAATGALSGTKLRPPLLSLLRYLTDDDEELRPEPLATLRVGLGPAHVPPAPTVSAARPGDACAELELTFAPGAEPLYDAVERWVVCFVCAPRGRPSRPIVRPARLPIFVAHLHNDARYAFKVAERGALAAGRG